MIDSEYFKRRLEVYKASERLCNIKKDHDQFVVELRKSKRIENFKRKRYDETSIQDLNVFIEEILYIGICSDSMLNFYPEIFYLTSELEKLRFYKNVLCSANVPEVLILEILTIFRMSLSASVNHAQIFVKENLVPVFIFYVKDEFSFEVNSEAMWCLCNIASGPREFCEEMKKFGILKCILYGIQSKYGDLIANCLWTVANMVSDDQDFLEDLISNNFLQMISGIDRKNEDVFKSLAFCIANLCKYTSCVKSNEFKIIFEIFPEILSIDLPNYLIAIYFITLYDQEKILLLKELNFLNPIIKGLVLPTSNTLKVISIIVNITSGPYSQLDYLIGLGLLDLLIDYFKATNNELVKNIYTILNNIANSIEFRQMLFDNKILINSLPGLIHSDWEIRKESCIFFQNLTIQLEPKNKEILELSEIFRFLEINLKESDANCLQNSIGICENLLETPEKRENIKKIFTESGCLAVIEELSGHLNQEISRRCIDLIDKYFM